MTAVGRFPDRSTLDLAVEAFVAALTDAGLDRGEVDGFVTNIGHPLGVDYDQFAHAVGVDLRWALQTWTHGRFVGTALQAAALAVGAGLADCVACVCAAAFTRLGQLGGVEDVEGSRPGGASHGERPEHGMTSPGAGAALAARRYFDRYGVGSEDLAHVAVALRAHAARNPGALRRDPIAVADHQASRHVVEPLRLLDYCQVTDGAACVLVTRGDRAAATRDGRVRILGAQGIRSGREEFIFGPRGGGLEQQADAPAGPDARDLAAYAMAGVEREDVQLLYTYDAFTPLVWFALERFGFCGRGEAPAFVASGAIGPGGALPVNTNGGLHSEGHVSGWNHLVELVRQLRGEAGERQVEGARVAQWGTVFGDSIVFAAG